MWIMPDAPLPFEEDEDEEIPPDGPDSGWEPE
jgi:hypothetical protein